MQFQNKSELYNIFMLFVWKIFVFISAVSANAQYFSLHFTVSWLIEPDGIIISFCSCSNVSLVITEITVYLLIKSVVKYNLEELITPSTTWLGLEVKVSRSWQCISCNWHYCSNHLDISELTWKVLRLYPRDFGVVRNAQALNTISNRIWARVV